jgi:hypothetical protein
VLDQPWKIQRVLKLEHLDSSLEVGNVAIEGHVSAYQLQGG